MKEYKVFDELTREQVSHLGQLLMNHYEFDLPTYKGHVMAIFEEEEEDYLPTRTDIKK